MSLQMAIVAGDQFTNPIMPNAIDDDVSLYGLLLRYTYVRTARLN